MSDRRAVLFVDIADSTRLYRSLGDIAARTLVLQCLSLLEDVVALHRGEVVDQIGDELMCTFPTAGGAVRAATRLQESMAPFDESRAAVSRVAVRIGMHYGPVIRDGAKVFGNTVYTARRVASLAKAYQILFTAGTLRALPRRHRFEVRFVDSQVLKGFRRPVDIYEVIWDVMRATRARLDERKRTSVAVKLRWGTEELFANAKRPLLRIGRSRACDLSLDDHDVSLLHAQIECGKTAVMLTDFSTNGTYVLPHGVSQCTIVHRDTVPLTGEGLIGIGRQPRAGDSVTVWYSCP